MAVQNKTYRYEVSRDNVFLGVLPGVISPFSYQQRINTAGAELPVTVQKKFDLSDEAPPQLETESGIGITTESGEPLTAQRQPDLIGPQDSEALIRNNNDVVVYEFSEDYPNGVPVFEGKMTRWRAKYGAGSDIIDFSIIGYGYELDNYVAKSGASLVINQSGDDGSSRSFSSLGGVSGNSRVAQSFRATGTYAIPKISVKVRNQYNWFYNVDLSKIMKLSLYQGVIAGGELNPTGGGTLLGSAQVEVKQKAYTLTDFVFGTPIDVTSGTDYYFVLESTTPTTDPIVDFQVAATGTTSVLANSQAYTYYSPFGTNPEAWQDYGGGSSEDFTFQVYSGGTNTTAEYSDTDPREMLLDAMDSYIGQGGNVGYDAANVEATPYLIDYTFILATIKEVAEKTKEMAPSTWYWFVDPADSQLYWKDTNMDGDHILVKGTHLSELEIEASVEEIKNLVLFSGGDTGGGVNLYNQYTNQDSLDSTGVQKLERLSDNRVTVSATADALAESYLEEHADEIFRSGLVLPSSVYDVHTVKVGHTVKFQGFGNWIDTLVLQITELRRESDGLGLTFGPLPLRANSYIDSIKRDLEKEQTINNPDAPS